MPKIGNQKYKVLLLKDILMKETDEDHQLNASELIAELDKNGVVAERKSIYTDIAALQEAGVDVVKGEHGYYVASREFELPELKLLVDAVGASKFISEKKSRTLLKKIEGLASVHEARQLSRQVVVPDRVKTENEKIFYTIDVIYQCIDLNKQMTFNYEEWTINKTKELRRDGMVYQVSPAFLIRNDENYYLVAYDEFNQEIRHYRVDKVVNAKVSNLDRGGCEMRESLNKEEYAKRHVSMFSGTNELVTLRAPQSMVGIFLDKYGTDISIRKEDDGYIRIRTNVAVSYQFYGWVTGVGATIVAPESIATEYKKYIQSLLDKY